MIAVIDYGAGNLRSVTNALSLLGYQPTITHEPHDVLNADIVFLPGVGAAGDAMRSLNETGLSTAIQQVIRQGRPFFAICIGMQIMLSVTEEGGLHDCLGITPGRVKRLPSGITVPHMGWNQVKQIIAHPIFDGIPDEANFYFVHSYYTDPEDTSVIAGTTEYGVSLCSMLIKDNVVATQFHPEKSGEYGLKMYSNFLKLAGAEK
ncbi:MAG: imidazole glycerol phosphate synthase subunit HisH [Chloroflexota bacterium]|nr:imidazole glycerol phosphate synthase subunit HisH [Chloroflexota bacterium]